MNGFSQHSPGTSRYRLGRRNALAGGAALALAPAVTECKRVDSEPTGTWRDVVVGVWFRVLEVDPGSNPHGLEPGMVVRFDMHAPPDIVRPPARCGAEFFSKFHGAAVRGLVVGVDTVYALDQVTDA